MRGLEEGEERKPGRKTMSRQRKLRKKENNKGDKRERQEIKRTYVKQHIHTMITVDDPHFQNLKLSRPQQNRENAVS